MLNEDSELSKTEQIRRWIEVVGLATDVIYMGGGNFAGIRDIMTRYSIYRFGSEKDRVILSDRWDYISYNDAKTALDAWAVSGKKDPAGWVDHPLVSERMITGIF